MKIQLILVLLVCLFACKTDTSKQNEAKNAINPLLSKDLVITPELVDSLRKNRMQILTELRKAVGYHCVKFINKDYMYFKIDVDSNGNYSNVSVVEKENIDIEPIRQCIEDFMAKEKTNLGFIREMPDSKYGAIPRIKSYTLRVF